MLLITDSIYRKEILRYQNIFSDEVLISSYEKTKLGLSVEIKGSPIKNSKLFKSYVTTPDGAGRVVFLLIVDEDKYLPIITRPKKDKEIGDNISIRNRKFVITLKRHLDFAMMDLENGQYKVLSL